ncbi:MAG: uncharacterized protein A8A55_1369 [Amphiamblys sp. WSBS2006]|nr:MAG: uncharacterized protein A8A55_1369 [Amphiamblys sp. WSBS2006]
MSEEKVAVLRELFSILDKDGDGVLTRRDLVGVRVGGKKTDEGDVAQLFLDAGVESTDDEEITLSLFVSMFVERERREDAELHRAIEALVRVCGENGAVKKRRLGRLLQEGRGGLTESEAETLLAEFPERELSAREIIDVFSFNEK